MRRPRHVVQLGAAVAALVAVLVSASAASADGLAHPIALTRGATAGTRWEVTVASTSVGRSKLPGLCFGFMFGDGYGEGGTNCVAPAQGHSAKGPPWTFDPNVIYHGLTPATITRTTGLRSVMFLVVANAHLVVARLTDGEVLHLKPTPIPSKLHRSGAIALSVRHIGSSKSIPPSVRVKSGVAYGADGKVVGRMSRSAPPLEDWTYG
jgi:hypothetical protein